MVKQDLVVEIYYGGAWHDLTALGDVRASDTVTCAYGSGPDAQRAETAQAGMRLSGRERIYNPADPRSHLYGVASMHPPLRVAMHHGLSSGPLADVTDSYSRTVASGWGNPDTGPTWNGLNFGSGGTPGATDFRVAAGVGEMDVPGAGWYRAIAVASIAATDTDQVVTVTAPVATGADLEVAGLMARGTSISSYILGRVHLTTAGAVVAKIYSADSDLLGQVTTGLTHDGSPLRVRMRVTGVDVTMRVWDPDGAEPDTWDLAVVDSTTAPVAGWVGVRTGRDASNTNTTEPQATYNDYALTVFDPRFSGLVRSWQPDQTLDWGAGSGRGDAWTDITAEGLIGQLGQGDPVVQSAAYRYITRLGPVAYWPLEDPDGADRGRSAVAGVPDLTTPVVSAAGATLPAGQKPQFGQGPTPAGSAPGVDLTRGGTLLADFPPTTGETSWEMHFTAQYASGVFDGETVFHPTVIMYTDSAAPSYWSVTFADDLATVATDVSPFIRTATYDLGDGAPHHIALYAAQAGGSVSFALLVDGSIVLTNSYTGNVGAPRRVELNGTNAVDGKLPEGIAHLAIFVPYPTTDETTDAVRAAHGWPSEAAGRRIERICAEEDITLTTSGDLDETRPMGPQPTAGIIDVIGECAAVDSGVLAEPRTHLGLTYRTGHDLYNQAVALALDMTSGHITPGLGQAVDTLGVANDITVDRAVGGQARVQRTVGPLNVADPRDDVDGIGRRPESYRRNTHRPEHLAGQASWLLSQATWPGPRFTALGVDLVADTSLAVTAGAVRPGDVVTVTGLYPDLAELITTRQTEVITTHGRTIGYDVLAAGPYTVAVADDEDLARADSAHSALGADFDAGTDTSMSVVVTDGLLWRTGSSGPTFPLDIVAAGVRLRVSAISGASSPQTFTVSSTTVNGVEKTIVAGTQVRVWRGARAAL